jgi:hypothetical protein
MLLYATLRYSTLLYATLRYSTLLHATLRYSTLRYALPSTLYGAGTILKWYGMSSDPATSEAGARWPRFGLVVVATTIRPDD